METIIVTGLKLGNQTERVKGLAEVHTLDEVLENNGLLQEGAKVFYYGLLDTPDTLKEAEGLWRVARLQGCNCYYMQPCKDVLQGIARPSYLSAEWLKAQRQYAESDPNPLRADNIERHFYTAHELAATTAERQRIEKLAGEYNLDLKQALWRQAEKDEREQNRKEMAAVADGLARALTTGDVAQAKVLETEFNRLSTAGAVGRYADELREGFNVAAVCSYLKRERRDLYTGVRLYNPKRDEWSGCELVFPRGALSILAAPRSHGKTTALIALCASMAKNNPDKVFYYISFEETKEAIEAKLLQAIRGLSRTEIEEMSAEEIEDMASRNLVAQRIYVKRWRARSPRERMTAESLAETFTKIDTRNCGGIFIDYMQRVTIDNPTAFREDMGVAAQVLEDIAINTDCAVVVGSQMNREAINPEEQTTFRIAESTFIEQVAANIYAMWDLRQQPIYNKKNDYTEKLNREKGVPVYDIENPMKWAGFEWVRVLKNRNLTGGAAIDTCGAISIDFSRFAIHTCSEEDTNRLNTAAAAEQPIF